MKFKRVDQKTVRCIISEDEIIERGLNIEDLLHNGDKVQEFLNEVVDLAEAETGFKLTSGIQAVQAAFLPNKDIVFTFSDQPQGPGLEKTLEQWKDLFLESQTGNSKQKDSEQKQILEQKDLYLTIPFQTISKAAHFSSHIPFNLLCESKLYRWKKEYYLLIIIKNVTSQMRQTMDAILGEYANRCSKSSARTYYIQEHGEAILPKDATDLLNNIFS